MNKPIVSTDSTLKPSAHGWRLTYYDAGGEPVASFWALTQQGTFDMAKQHVARA
jgi:hypothetical protein